MRSMTGYGRGEFSRDGSKVVIEVRSVNRRQAELNLRLPRDLEALEARIRDVANASFARGRCDLIASLERPEAATQARVNQSLAMAYAAQFTALRQQLNLREEVSLEVLSRCPGVLESPQSEVDPETMWPLIEPALKQALSAFNEMREREGTHLADDLSLRIQEMRAAHQRVRTQAPEVGRRFREQLLQRIRSAGLDGISMDDERLLKEVVLFADRSDISEELARLESHFAQFDACKKATDAVGRKLDFLAQEMNREVNTIGSKANDALISADVVLLKTELERFREQAQNVE
jgi:uncharacterized protein (TIGR00255 family)